MSWNAQCWRPAGGNQRVELVGPTLLHDGFGSSRPLSSWSETGTAAPNCANCDWAFNLTLSGGTASGESCAGAGIVGGEWDGFTASWGFAESYPYSYGGTDYTFELAVLYFSTTYGWFPLAYNYGGFGYNTGDASGMTFLRLYDYIYIY